MDIINSAVNTPLFRGMTTDETAKVLNCTGAVISCYKDKEKIISADNSVSRIGVIISGHAVMIQYNYSGERSLISKLSKNDLFGTTIKSPIFNDTLSVCASGECSALLFDTEKLFNGCENNCINHSLIYHNLVFLLVEKNLNLVHTLHHLSYRSLRGKITSYLSEQMRLAGKKEFIVPLDRQEMADYLACDRSALSAELSRMKRDGLIDYKKNSFIMF